MVDKTNARAKAAGGYRVMPPIIKNKGADVYYRRAIEAETDKMLTAIFAKLERVYTTVKVSNAATGANKPSVSNIMKLITYYKKVYLPKFLRNAEKIIDKFINLATRNAKRSITKSMRQLYGDDFAVNWNGKDIDDILRLIIRRNVGLITVSNYNVRNQNSVAALRQLAQMTGLDIYSSKGRLYIKKAGQNIPSGNVVTLTTKDIIGIPEPTETGVIINVRLNSSLISGQSVKVDSFKYPQLKSYDFFISTLSHNGDTRGRDWYTRLNLTTPGLGFY